MRWFLLFALVLLAPAANASVDCKQLSVFAGTTAVDRDHGMSYETKLKNTEALPAPAHVKPFLLAVVAFVYRYNGDPNETMNALYRACTAPRIVV